MGNKTVIIITGPTASGKTSMALRLAGKYQTSIISADSRQCFREMNIGVAKPDASALAGIRHYFINSHSVLEEVNAGTFEQYALKAADEIFSTNDIAVMAGGTGLYIKAFCEGLDDMPLIDPSLRKKIQADYESFGMEWLRETIKTSDPVFFETGEIQNPQRMMRALEVKLTTGESIKQFQQRRITARSFAIRKIAPDISKQQLHANINNRVDEMMSAGLLSEVESLLPYRHLNALRTVGYTELLEHIDGKTTLAEAVEKIKSNTRQYAKRQMTWFRKDKTIEWVRI